MAQRSVCCFCLLALRYTGFDILPPGGFKAEQSAQYPADRAEYEALLIAEAPRILEVQTHELGNLPHPQKQAAATHHASSSAGGASSGSDAMAMVDSSRNNSSSHGSSPHPLSTTQQHTDSSSGSDAVTSPPTTALPAAASSSSAAAAAAVATTAADDDACLRWNLLKVMCFLSGMRGEMNKNPPFSLYRCCTILTRAFISPLTIGAVRTLILYFLVEILKLLATTPEEEREVVRTADLATLAAQAHDTTHCPFYSLCFHLIGQIHLQALDSPSASAAQAAETNLAADLDICDKVSTKWEFGLPILSNLHARIIQRFLSLKRTPTAPAIRALFERNQIDMAAGAGGAALSQAQPPQAAGHEDEPGLSAADRARAAAIYTSTTIPAYRPLGGGAPTIADTMSALNENFGSTLRLNDQELIDMQQRRKGLTVGTQAQGNSNFNLPPTTQPIHLNPPAMQSSALNAPPFDALSSSPAAAAAVSGPFNPSPPLEHRRLSSSDPFLSPLDPQRGLSRGLEDSMQFEIDRGGGMDSPVPTHELVSPPMQTHRMQHPPQQQQHATAAAGALYLQGTGAYAQPFGEMYPPSTQMRQSAYSGIKQEAPQQMPMQQQRASQMPPLPPLPPLPQTPYASTQQLPSWQPPSSMLPAQMPHMSEMQLREADLQRQLQALLAQQQQQQQLQHQQLQQWQRQQQQQQQQSQPQLSPYASPPPTVSGGYSMQPAPQSQQQWSPYSQQQQTPTNYMPQSQQQQQSHLPSGQQPYLGLSVDPAGGPMLSPLSGYATASPHSQPTPPQQTPPQQQRMMMTGSGGGAAAAGGDARTQQQQPQQQQPQQSQPRWTS